MPDPAAEPVGRTVGAVGEGAVWDAQAEELLWVDIPAGLVHRWSVEAGERTARFAGQVGAVAPRAGGGLALALDRGFVLVDRDGAVRQVVRLLDGPFVRMNDGACDSRGRFWAGSMATDGRPGMGALFRFDPDLSVERILDGVGVSNGIAWSPDDARMFYVDTPCQRVDVLDFDAAAGRVSGRRTFAAIDPDDGLPDGIAADADGGVWVALWGGSVVRRYGPDGTLDDERRIPATQVTSCAFGGRELDELYVTTASLGLDDAERAEQPLAGRLFRLDPGVRGLPATPFAG